MKLSILARGGFRRCIMGRYFYWPASLSRQEVERQAELLVLTGKRLKLLGLAWSDEEIDNALRVGGQLPANRAKANDRRERDRVERERKERTERRRAERDTFHRGLEDYVEHLFTRDVSQAYKTRGRAAIALVKRLAPDVQFKWFDLRMLGTLADAIHGGDYAAATIRTTLHFLREALDYVDTRGRWEMTLRGSKLLRPRRARGPARSIEVYTPEELAGLYVASPMLLKAAMLLSLNCGFTTAELATLTHEHLALIEDIVRVEKNRTKTGNRGEWVLWPETVKALRATGWHPKRTGLVLRTNRGTPLCHYSPRSGERSDALGLAWRRLTQSERADGHALLPAARRLPFKVLRKTGASMIRDIAGLEVAQMYLAHKGQSVAERHYLGRPADALSVALQAMRTRLGLPWTLRRP